MRSAHRGGGGFTSFPAVLPDNSRKRMTGPRARQLQKLGDAIHHRSRRSDKRRHQHCGF
ncbi:hypothetical protein KCP73_10050 [Salmonella enterica subsp. enterica]|nr:hypothetical protein KCP73_10050 [Salmonella enterica subsp. enterica]